MEGLSWLNAEESWMDRVRHTKKPVVVYGMGNGADKLFALLKGQGVAVADVMASDGFVRGHAYRGFRVKTYHEICERYGDVLILLAFATDLADVMEGIRRIAREQEVYALIFPCLAAVYLMPPMQKPMQASWRRSMPAWRMRNLGA